MLGVFDGIKFLDDCTRGGGVIEIFDEYLKFQLDFPVAFIALGNNELRMQWTRKLQEAGFLLPKLIHHSGTAPTHIQFTNTERGTDYDYTKVHTI